MGRFTNFVNRVLRRNDTPYTKSVVNMSGGSFVSPDTALKVSAYYRGLMFISGQLSKLKWEVKTADNKVQRDNKLYYLLNYSPNKEMTAFNFKMALIQTAINNGNAYAEIERNLIGEPVAIWPLTAFSVSPFRDGEGNLFYRVGDGQNTVLRPEDVLHIRNLHTFDGIMGQGVAAYGSEVLGIALGADRFANSMYANSGMPSGILSTTGKLSPEAKKRVAESWKENMGGKKSGSTAVLDEGMSYTQVTLDPEALQMLGSRKFGVAEIARFLGVSPIMLYDPDVQNYNNVEQGGLAIANDTLSVWAVNLQSEVQMKLFTGRYARFINELNMYDLFKADMDTRGTFFTKMLQAGAFTPNQVLIEEGMEPYEGGDRRYIATNNLTPIDKIDDLIDSQIERNKSSSNKDNNPNQTKADSNIQAELDKAALDYLRAKAK